MIFDQIRSRLRTRLRGFAADRNGVSAIEFAVLAPLMITLYLGGIEVTQAVSADRKTTLVARTVADLVAQCSNVTDADMTDVLKASTAVMIPFSASVLAVTVSSIAIDNTGKATIAWSYPPATAHQVGSTVTLPAALLVPNTSLIWGEATYSYKPTFGWVLTGTISLYDKIYMRPRQASSVTRNGPNACQAA